MYQPDDYRRIALWRDVPLEEWRDHRWQLRHRIHDVATLRQVLELTPREEAAVAKREGRFIMSIPPYWANLMDRTDPACPIRMQAVPVEEEYRTSPNDFRDPLAEDRDSPVPGLVHRYPDRVLLLSTSVCAMYCRHCTRSRVVGTEAQFSRPQNLEAAYAYLREHTEVRDVLISGGDPLMLSDGKLDDILTHLRAIPHIEFIRIGTRTPVTLPFRVTDAFLAVLKQHAPVWMSLHFNHPQEITTDLKVAMDRLADHGIPLGCQTVLLKGINDDPRIMQRLVHELLQVRVRPYYLYQCDPVRGTSHFRTTIETGVRIIEALRGHTTGYAVPTYVVDAPGGGGKIPVNPNYVVERRNGTYTFQNYAGQRFTYTEEPSTNGQRKSTGTNGRKKTVTPEPAWMQVD